MNCNFCEDRADLLKFWKEAGRKVKFSVALVEDAKGGRTTMYGYKLNFCPVCGKEITKGSERN